MGTVSRLLHTVHASLVASRNIRDRRLERTVQSCPYEEKDLRRFLRQHSAIEYEIDDATHPQQVTITVASNMLL